MHINMGWLLGLGNVKESSTPLSDKHPEPTPEAIPELTIEEIERAKEKLIQLKKNIYGSLRYMNTVKLTMPNGDVYETKTPVMSVATWLGLIGMSRPWIKINDNLYVNINEVAKVEMIMHDHYADLQAE